MKSKVAYFKSTYSKYIMEGHFGDIFISVNILGDFLSRLFQGGMNQIQNKVRHEAKILALNENVMREVYFNTDQIAEIYETICG